LDGLALLDGPWRVGTRIPANGTESTLIDPRVTLM
jgi:hypothetical protein